MRPLRPHQTEALSLLKSSLLARKRRPLLQAPTGFGKTLLSAAIVDGARRKGNRVLFVVPALSLVDQTVNAFFHEGIHEIGVMQGAHEMSDWSQPVQVASVQTLMRRKLPACDVAIVDEAHRWFKWYGEWFAQAEHPIIGLSATPWTKGLGKHYDDLIIAATTADLIRDKYLSPFRVFAPSHPDLSGVRTVAGDYHEGDLSKAMDQAPLVADVVETWLRRGENRPTLCFAVDRAHAKHLCERFEAVGVPAAYVDAYTEREDREEIARRFARGEVKVICNVGVLTTGIDYDVRCIILARPTKSEMLYVQIIGRGLRTAHDKQDCLILDHSDTTLRLGFVDEICHDTLDDGTMRATPKQRKESLPKECRQCSFLKPPKTAVCPSCGFKAEVRSSIQCEDGELIELRAGKASKMTAPEKARFYGELKHYARGRGYSEGWISHKFREKTGVWPNHYAGQPAIEPSPETLSWIKSRQIAFAKRREAGHAAAA